MLKGVADQTFFLLQLMTYAQNLAVTAILISIAQTLTDWLHRVGVFIVRIANSLFAHRPEQAFSLDPARIQLASLRTLLISVISTPTL
jgi:hypothetical protein